LLRSLRKEKREEQEVLALLSIGLSELVHICNLIYLEGRDQKDCHQGHHGQNVNKTLAVNRHSICSGQKYETLSEYLKNNWSKMAGCVAQLVAHLLATARPRLQTAVLPNNKK
jgi:hypothetical protein